MRDNNKIAIEEIPADAVIQALKCCTSSEYNCHHCPFKGVGTISDSCISAMSRSALDLIYRKQSEAQRQIPCEIGSKIYEVTGEPGERIDIDEYTVSEVGLNGVFTRGGFPCYRPHRHYFAYADEGAWWFFKREDAEAERKRRDDP